MVTLSDRYGDLDLEDLVDDEFDGLEPDNEREIDFGGAIFQPGEVRSFEQDFGYELDSTLAHLDTQDPEWSDEFQDQIDEQEYFERTIEREAE